MRWIARAALVAVVIGLLLAGAVAWVVPGVARRAAERGLFEATGRKLAIGELSIHPFTWKVEARDVSLSEPGGDGTFASLKRAEASLGLSSIWKGAPVVSKVRLEGPHFEIVRTAPNTYNFSDLLPYLTLPVPAIVLNDVAISGGSIDFHDRALSPEELHTVRDAELVVPFLTTLPDQATQYGTPRFHAVVDGAPLTVETRVRGLPKAVEAYATVDLKDLSLPRYLAYVPADIPVKVDAGKLAIQGTASYRVGDEWGPEAGWDGTVTLSEVKLAEKRARARISFGSLAVRSRVTSGEKRGLLLSGGAIELRDVAIPFRGKDGLQVGALSLQGVSYSAKKNALEVGSAGVEHGRLRVSRDRRGVFSPQPLLHELTQALPRPKAAPPRSPPSYRVGTVEATDIDVTFTDGTRKELPSFAVTGAHAVARDVTGPATGKIPFEFGARWGKDATIEGKGWMHPTPLALDAELRIQGVRLADAGPYVNEDAQVVLAGGRLDATLAARLETRDDRLRGTFRGATAIRGLDVLDRDGGKLVAWESLAVDGIAGSVEPLAVQVARVELAGLHANVVLGPDGKLAIPRRNAGSAKAPPDGGSKASVEGSGKQPVDARHAGVRPDVRIDDFHVARGTVDFTDKSIPGEFKARIQDVDVRIKGITGEPGKTADLHARLVLPKGAPLTLAGRVAPLKEPASADVDLVIDKLDLTTATPYAATFLGLEIDEGSLTVKSRAKVENGDLAAENRIWVENLTYGKGVKSDKATILPVRLLTDMLRNRDGDIVLVLPIAAKTTDENLSGKIVGQVVKETLFPPGSPLQSIPFDGCSWALGADAQGRLRKLAAALDERKAMKIVAVGYVDRAVDEKACADRLAAEAAARAQAASAPPARSATAPEAAPSSSPLLSLEGDARLRYVAVARADAVRSFLVDQGKLDPARLGSRAGDIHAPPSRAGDARPRVEFVRMED